MHTYMAEKEIETETDRLTGHVVMRFSNICLTEPDRQAYKSVGSVGSVGRV